jgi:hypothetical protein
LFSRVPDILGFTEINNFFRNIRRVIGDSLEAFGHDHQVQTSGHSLRIMNHVISQVAVNFLV